jgi:hypothetical protein
MEKGYGNFYTLTKVGIAEDIAMLISAKHGLFQHQLLAHGKSIFAPNQEAAMQV